MSKDPTCSKDKIDRFQKYVKDILKVMNIEDD